MERMIPIGFGNMVNAAKIIGVVKPGAVTATKATRNGKIGVIATEGTINSQIYTQYIKDLKQDAEVLGKACPLFVPLAEEGLWQDPVTDEIASRYLLELIDIDIDTLILGCTHYPFLIETLEKTIDELRHYKNSNGEYVYAGLIAKDLEFIDPAVYTALECYQTLRADNQLALNPGKGKLDAYISVPVYGLAPDCIDDDGNLTYDFKYGREFGTDDITTVFVPFSRRYLDSATLERIEGMLPKSYEKIKQIIE